MHCGMVWHIIRMKNFFMKTWHLKSDCLGSNPGSDDFLTVTLGKSLSVP